MNILDKIADAERTYARISLHQTTIAEAERVMAAAERTLAEARRTAENDVAAWSSFEKENPKLTTIVKTKIDALLEAGFTVTGEPAAPALTPPSEITETASPANDRLDSPSNAPNDAPVPLRASATVLTKAPEPEETVAIEPVESVAHSAKAEASEPGATGKKPRRAPAGSKPKAEATPIEATVPEPEAVVESDENVVQPSEAEASEGEATDAASSDDRNEQLAQPRRSRTGPRAGGEEMMIGVMNAIVPNRPSGSSSRKSNVEFKQIWSRNYHAAFDRAMDGEPSMPNDAPGPSRDGYLKGYEHGLEYRAKKANDTEDATEQNVAIASTATKPSDDTTQDFNTGSSASPEPLEASDDDQPIALEAVDQTSVHKDIDQPKAVEDMVNTKMIDFDFISASEASEEACD